VASGTSAGWRHDAQEDTATDAASAQQTATWRSFVTDISAYSTSPHVGDEPAASRVT
jgi:hypothetical protein